MVFVHGIPAVLFWQTPYEGASVSSDTMLEYAGHVVTRLPVQGSAAEHAQQEHELQPHEQGPPGIPDTVLAQLHYDVFAVMRATPQDQWSEVYIEFRRLVYRRGVMA